MNPKNGTAGTAVEPTEPAAVIEADKAEPGKNSKIASGGASGGASESSSGGSSGSKSGKNSSQADPSDSENLQPHKPPQKGVASDAGQSNQKKSWIEIELLDEDRKPVPGKKYRVVLPDNKKVAEGTLDEKGFARIEGIDPGTCEVSFPKLDKDAWKKE